MSEFIPNEHPLDLDDGATTSAKCEATAFSEKFIKSFPRSHKKVPISVSPFSLKTDETNSHNIQSMFISPHGIEFQAPGEFREGSLIKVDIALPDYWSRKQSLVEYRRIDVPKRFRILAKVLKVDGIGKRGKKKHVIAQTVNLDSADEQVLRGFLEEG